MEINVESLIASQVLQQPPSWKLIDLPRPEPVVEPCVQYVGDFRVDRATAHRSELFVDQVDQADR